MQRTKHFAQMFINKAGYTIRKTSSETYGINLWFDINRLSNALNRPIKTVFDVGANNGTTTTEAIKTFPNCHVYAFEPHPKVFNDLRINLGKLQNFTPVQLALSNEIGVRKFYDYGGGGQANSLTPDARFAKRFNIPAQEIELSVKTLDLFCEENKIARINVLKTDTEGNDFSVFLGAKTMLKTRAIDFIYFEFNDFCLKNGTRGGSLNEITNYLSEYDFHFIATYTDFILMEGELFVVANALLARGN